MMCKVIELIHSTPIQLGVQYRQENARNGIVGKMFDWDKAMKIINLKHIANASIGLAEDWFFTGQQIIKDGEPYYSEESHGDNIRYFAFSDWATPCIYDMDKDVAYECWTERTDKDLHDLTHFSWTQDLINKLHGDNNE